jgi:D-3-phosphoglycerate dehydrogenase
MLKNNKISVAALDVFNDEPYYGKFIKLKNVLLTPHIAGYAKEIRLSMEREAINMIVKNYAI